MSPRERAKKSESVLLNERHLKILQSVVDGFRATKEIAEQTGFSEGVVAGLRGEIKYSFRGTSIGNDSMALAVVFVVRNKLVDCESLRDIRRKRRFSEREINIIFSMVLGFDNNQAADRLNLTREQIRGQQRDIMDNLNVESPYTVIAWAVWDTMRRLKNV